MLASRQALCNGHIRLLNISSTMQGCTLSRRDVTLLACRTLLAGAGGWFSAAAIAEDSGLISRRISDFYGALLESMKAADRVPVKGRYDRLEPAVRMTFDLPAMTRIAVGPAWSTMTADEQRDVTAQFSRLTIANYASRFDGYSGERFEVEPTVETRGQNRVVHSRLVLTKGEPVALNYLMRDGADGWKVIDVYLSGTISELATRRSEFGALIRSGGASALVASLRERADALLRT
jgi:phospholipid transport system substrate-binding protein